MEKLVDTLKYSYQDIFQEVLQDFFDTEFKLEIIRALEDQKEQLVKSIKDKIKTGLYGLADRIEVDPHSWDLEKQIKEWVKIRKD